MVLKRGDMVFAIGVGMISGWWIFGIPLRDASRRQQLQQSPQAPMDAESRQALAAAQEPPPTTSQCATPKPGSAGAPAGTPGVVEPKR